MGKYNYIVIGADNYDVYRYAFYEFNSLDYAYYDSEFLDVDDIMSRILRRIHWNSKIKLPGKSIWINKCLKKYQKLEKTFRKQKPLCFLILGWNARLEQFGLSDCIHKMFPDAKIIWYFCDLVKKDKYKNDLLVHRSKSISAIFSFDYSDAYHYGLFFHNIPYSFLNDLFYSNSIEYDICFVGQAKDRLHDILDVHKKLKKKGLKCYFNVVGVVEKNQIIREEIVYSDFVPYDKYLRIVSRSKCILEIMQKGGTGSTLRLGEAIAFNKLLLSNNYTLRQNAWYDEENMLVFDDAEEVPASFVLNKNNIIYKKRNDILPSRFLKHIEEVLV